MKNKREKVDCTRIYGFEWEAGREGEGFTRIPESSRRRQQGPQSLGPIMRRIRQIGGVIWAPHQIRQIGGYGLSPPSNPSNWGVWFGPLIKPVKLPVKTSGRPGPLPPPSDYTSRPPPFASRALPAAHCSFVIRYSPHRVNE